MLLRPILNKDPGPTSRSGRPGRWLRRFGVGAFAFFLIKGLLWLLVPALLITLNWIRG